MCKNLKVNLAVMFLPGICIALWKMESEVYINTAAGCSLLGACCWPKDLKPLRWAA